MSEQEQFIQDMADSLKEVKATARQKEIYKAVLRHAITYAEVRVAIRKRKLAELVT